MITYDKLSERVSRAAESGSVVEIPDELLDYVSGGCGPEDFCESFYDNYSDGPIVGPTFVESFTDRFPYRDSDYLP